MPENNKTEELLKKLAPCITRGDLDACVEEAARLAREMGISAGDLHGLSIQAGRAGIHVAAYVLACAAAQGLEGKEMAGAHYNAGVAAKFLGNVETAEQHYKQAVDADPNDAAAHYNYANLLSELDRKTEAEEHYKQAVAADPKYAAAHSNYAILLKELDRKTEAEEHYKQAVAADPKYAAAHGAYGLLLVELDRREKARDETENASKLFSEAGRITDSYLALAWFYERYSEKYFNMRKFPESGEDAAKAGGEYLKAAETADGALKDIFSQQGNILKAKSFVRKVPKESWRRKILYWLGRKRDIPEIINNLKQAASYYEKAAMCPVGEKQDVCNACHISISVFSETLSAMDAFINKKTPEINKKAWITKLDSARRIYEEKKLANGVALVDTLKQLIQCIDEMAVHRANRLGIQKDKCGKCYSRLAEVSENLDGALNVLAEYSIEAIRDYAKKQGMGGYVTDTQKKSIFNNWFVRVVIFVAATIFLNLVSSKLYDLNIISIIWNYLKSIISLP